LIADARCLERDAEPLGIFVRKSFAVLAAMLLGALWEAAPLHAQEIRTVRGTVIDVESAEPIDGMIVRVMGTEVAAVTDSAGTFELRRVPLGRQTFRFQRIGEGTSEMVVDPPPSELLVVRVEPAPVVLPGIAAEARSFEARMDSIMDFMDRAAYGRYWTGGNQSLPRVAGIEKMREYHDVDDPELALAALGVTPAMDFDCSVAPYGAGGHGDRMAGRDRLPVMIYIDGERWPILGCDRLRAMDTSSICRMELFHAPGRGPPSPTVTMGGGSQPVDVDHYLRVWTCAFLARAAAADEPIPEVVEPNLLWPDFLSGGDD